MVFYTGPTDVKRPTRLPTGVVMLKLAENFKGAYPEASAILEQDCYMDDLIYSCKTHLEAAQRMKQLDEILASGSFHIKEWCCSNPETNISSEQNKADLEPSQINLKHFTGVNYDHDNLKTLGVVWNPRSDTIHFQVKDLEEDILTKRLVLSRLSMLYDPLGLASVVTIRARIAMQDIWRLTNLDWDDTLPDNHSEAWHNLFTDLKGLDTVSFPRCLKPELTSGEPELHIFADASAAAYGAVAYLLWPTPDGPSVRLVSAKARVAPLKQATIPRLELMAALIASRLAKTICDQFTEKPKITLWTDSRIVLHWIQSESIALKAFVGVRISEIQSTWEPSKWQFVPTDLNPADDLSRGLKTAEISGRWMNGPAFLKKPREEWPEQPPAHTPIEDVERKKTICLTVKTSPVIDCSKFSDWRKLLRITALCLRFVFNLRHKGSSKRKGLLEPEEIDQAEIYWIRHAQESLTDPFERCKDLCPFLENEILRVGGRLRRSSLTFEQAHPILLHASSHVSKLIMRDIHIKSGHPGCERTLCDSRRFFWIVKGRSLARETVRTCVICRKLRQPPHTTIMADLPPERLKIFSPVFTTTGIDLFGPFHLKYGRNKTTKAWGALFTCATVRAIHLEIVDGLSTMAFLQAFRRFVSQHGWPTTIISDNGTSFVGAHKELEKLFKEGRKQIEEFAMLHKVKWIFITPLSPHQGGFYESLIKQTKRALKVAVGEQILTWNEMSTVFCEVKCLVNSRPLGYSSNDPNDLQPITPNHLLLGRATAGIPQGPFEESRNLHKRFEFVQSLVNQFWKRFVSEYLPTLTRRTKWLMKGRQLKVGDVVLLTDSSIPRGRWNLARITRVFPGHDGIVRNVAVKTQSGLYRRSIQRCCQILDSNND